MTQQTTDQTEAAGTLPVPGASLHDHAMQEINAIEAGLADLEKQYAGVVYDVTTKEGMDAARAARQAIREPRYKVEKVRAETSSELTRIRTALNTEAKRITERIEKIEDPIHQQIKAEEDRIEAERAERRKAEAARVATLRASIDAIKGIPLSLIGAGEAEIREAINALNGRDLAAEFDDVWLPDAIAAKNAALPALDMLLSERIAATERQAQLEAEAAQRAAEAAEAAEKAKAAAEAAERERAAREEAERAAAAQRAQEEQERRAAEEAERQERAAEEQRQAAIGAAIDALRRKAFAPAKTSADIRALQDALAGAGPLTADTYGERVQEAEAARAEALDTLAGRLRLALDQEAEAERLQEAAAQAQREAEERAERERQEQAAREEREAQARAQAAAEAARRAALLYVVAMPDGSRWAVPLMLIANDRAKAYAGEFEDDLERSLAEDTLPLFESDPYQAHDWAANNMNWSDVKAEARIYNPATPMTDDDFQEGWVNGEYQVVNTKEAQA